MSLIFSPNSSKRHGVYLGGKAEAKSRSKLEQMGITHILNVTPEKDSSIQVSRMILHFICLKDISQEGRK